MAFITADRVLDSSTSTGTGAFVVSGTPAAGYRTFSAVMSVGDTCYYSIQGQTTSEWEVGLGTYSSANTLTRTTVYSSSNANAAVSFSAGTKNVFITMAASKSPQLDPSGNVTALGTPASIALTNATSLPLATGVTGTLSANNGGSLAWQSVQTGNFTAVAGNAYPVNTTSGAVTVTLPASPTAGQSLLITDYAGKFSTNACTISRNGSNINGQASNFTLNGTRESVSIVYIDATQGWVAYSGFVTSPLGINASYLVVGGGGGGGTAQSGVNLGGGGGAGGFLTNVITLVAGTPYTVVVGAGGAASTNGSLSSLTFAPTALGGGYGGNNVNNIGNSGGSGGGNTGANSAGPGGSGTSGQGNNGGSGSGSANGYGGGGGGGASAVGANGSATAGGNGGAGTASTITGSSVTYAGGGGGGVFTALTAGTGGAGGGGAGGTNGSAGTAGTANTGGGGGGSSQSGNTVAGGAGGSGVVILSVPTSLYSGVYSGSPTVTTSGGNTILKFTASGSYTA